ncbi:pilus assembly PilX family protein [Hydrogenophaga sp. MI9]|uniref:pilus assembly PilX family protein n=1 Tax=Hydrogenophaga sp. MI9 TaxID=3453719 RepID=UPI003EEB791E
MNNESTGPGAAPSCRHTPAVERGIVLPMALIMLVIISFAGLIAARNSASFEQFSNNMRTNQVARTSAEDALRRCERFAKDATDNGGTTYPSETGKILATQVSADTEAAIRAGAWNTRANWGSSGANILITVTPAFDTNVQGQAKLKPANYPTCIIQAMVNGRYLITARGLSNDAVVSSGGLLTAGTEVWLQSILTPSTPVLSASRGVE